MRGEIFVQKIFIKIVFVKVIAPEIPIKFIGIRSGEKIKKHCAQMMNI